MFGEPSDVDGECNARLFLGDNYGDGTTTMRCQLPPDHTDLHREQFEREGGMVTITWVTDERERCDHGCGQWRHDHHDENVVCPRDTADHEFSDCAYCHPGIESKRCLACGKMYYYEEGHRRQCQEGHDRPEETPSRPTSTDGPTTPQGAGDDEDVFAS